MSKGAASSSGSGKARAHVPARREAALAALAAAFAVVTAGSCLLVNPSFFLTDDYISQFRPAFYEIARLLAHGQFPLLTDRLWNGGDLLQEYQYAVLNPVCLLLYLAIGQIGDLATGAAVYSLFHIAILAAGVYALCRALGCLPRHALLAGAVAPLSDWIFFWGATNWIPALVSLAWLAWSWALLIHAWRDRVFAPAAAIAVALTLLSGWPFTDFALLVSALVAVRVLFVGGPRGRMRQAVWPALAVCAGGLLAMPALVPLAYYSAHSGRPILASGWATDLTSLLDFGMPLIQPRWPTWAVDLDQTVRQPMLYAAWFAPLALAGADWRSMARDRRVWIVLGSAIAFAALSMISHIGMLRWMFRLLPYYQLALIVAAAMALTRADQVGAAWTFDRLALVVAVEAWLAFSQTRSLALVYVAIAYAFGALAWISTRFGGRRDRRWTAMALAASAAVFALTLGTLARGGYPTFPQPWRPVAYRGVSIWNDARGPERFQLVHRLAGPTDPGASYWQTYPIMNLSLYRPGAAILGYSPMPRPAYGSLDCVTRITDDCSDVVAKVLVPIAGVGRNLLELMGVGEVDVERPAEAAAFAARTGGGWARSPLPGGGTRFLRPSREGQVTWASPGAAGVTRDGGLTRLVIDARNDAATPGRLIVARAWYPTWHATLNGAPVAASPLDETVIAVDLPPKSQGRLVLSFWPAGLTAGLLLAALGILLAVAGAVFPERIEAMADGVDGLISRRRTPKLSAA